jgi:glycosyltransferase involved in cell wall biosynthesis
VTRVAYVYPNERSAMIAGWRAGTSPETHLLGLNQLHEFGIEAEARAPKLESRGTGLAARATWHLRELTLPWELADFDVIFTPLANIVPVVARLRRRPRIVVLNFGLNTILRRAKPWRRRLLIGSLQRASAVVCLGASQRDELLQLSGIDPDRVPIAIHGVDEQFFTPSGTRADGLVVAVGKDLARDYATLVEAARRVDARVVVVALRRNLDGLDLPANIEVRERIPDIEVRELYDRAACVVLPLQPESYPYGSEGSGITALLEAEAMARPIVATDRPIVRDYVRHGETALLVPSREPDALREAIELVLGDAELAATMGSEGRVLVEREHTMRRMAADLAPVLKAAAR